MNFAEKTKALIKDQGRKKAWLAKNLNISAVLFHYKLEKNVFSYDEQRIIKESLGIKSMADYKSVMGV